MDRASAGLGRAGGTHHERERGIDPADGDSRRAGKGVAHVHRPHVRESGRGQLRSVLPRELRPRRPPGGYL